MKLMQMCVVFCLASLIGRSAQAKETITFPSTDGVTITADAYFVAPHATTPLIVLFHQADCSRGEYLEIAPLLNTLGYNCLAVDLRSGFMINDVTNETTNQARTAGKSIGWDDAFVDVEAALRYSRETYHPAKLIAWGSSYSASLVLKAAGDTPELLDGVLSFSPGEYFSKRNWILDSAKNIACPVFVTSAKLEKGDWSDIYDAIPSADKAFYLPETSGNHGSMALWSTYKDSQGYWDAVTAFLKKYFNAAAPK